MVISMNSILFQHISVWDRSTPPGMNFPPPCPCPHTVSLFLSHTSSHILALLSTAFLAHSLTDSMPLTHSVSLPSCTISISLFNTFSKTLSHIQWYTPTFIHCYLCTHIFSHCFLHTHACTVLCTHIFCLAYTFLCPYTYSQFFFFYIHASLSVILPLRQSHS